MQQRKKAAKRGRGKKGRTVGGMLGVVLKEYVRPSPVTRSPQTACMYIIKRLAILYPLRTCTKAIIPRPRQPEKKN